MANEASVRKVTIVLNEIGDTLLGAEKDCAKFEGGNNAAGGRARKALQKIKILAQEARIEIQRIKNEKKL